jgi:large subunit ribosomal protein L25
VVEVYCDPENIPEKFEADLGVLDINDNVRWSDLTGTDGMRPTIADRDFVIATVAAPTKVEVTAEQAAATPAAAAPAKGGTKAPGKAPAAAPAKPAAKKK